jgi:glucokinase
MGNKFYLGVDVGGTYTKLALVNDSCRIVARHVILSRGFSDKAFFVHELRAALSFLVSECGDHLSQIKGAGIGLPGPVDPEGGVVLSLTNIAKWDNFPFVTYLKRFFSFPIFIENDANCMALAESRLGAARGASYALCLTLGTGVGGGLILEKKIYRGPFFLGGEIGHVPVALSGERCPCGGAACLERYVGNRAIMARIKKEFAKNVSLEEVSSLARKGDHKAIKIWDDMGRYIGFALSGVVNVLNPEVIVVGGGVSLAGDILIRSIKRSVRKHAMGHLKGKIKVKKALLGKDAGVLGAALLAKEKLMNNKQRCST